MTLIAASAAALAIAAIAVSLYARRLRKALGRDDPTQYGADRP